MTSPGKTLLRLLVTMAAFVALAPPVAARLDADAAIAASRAAVGKPIADGRFLDTEGRELRLSTLRGKPLVVSMVYTSCPDVCPLTTRRLASVVDIAREALGDDAFTVVTVGFDSTADTPSRMRSFARGNGVYGDEHWRFLSADATTIAALANSIGFSFAPSAGGFEHLSQVTVVDADGLVYRQVYGDLLDPPVLVEPIKELVFGRRATAASVAGWIDNLKLLCTVYDPASGRYRFDYSVFVSAGVGLLALGGMGVFIFNAWRQNQHRGPTA